MPTKQPTKKTKTNLSKSAPQKKAAAKSAARAGPTIGSQAPAFALPATGGKTISSTGLKGQAYVLFFYPKDNTSGCTQEACDFRDNLAAFNKIKLAVIGVSKDTLKSHENFKAKFGLTFDLASDEDTELAKAYHCWVKKSMYGRSYMGMERSTFLIDAKGIIRGAWRKVSIPGHVAEVLAAAKNL